MHAKPRSCPSKILRRSPDVMSHSIILPSPLALTTLLSCMPIAFTGPSCPRNVQWSCRVLRFHTRMSASFELEDGHRCQRNRCEIINGSTYQLTIQRESIRRSNTPPEWPRSTAAISAATSLSTLPSPAPGRAYSAQTQIEQSLDPLTMKPRLQIRCASSSHHELSSPSSRSQSLSNLRHSTLPRCPENVARQRPVFRLHTLIVRSREPVMIR